MIEDFRSVGLSGALSYGRVRVLFHEGLMRVYDADGLLLQLGAGKPMRRPRFLFTWDVETERGPVTMRIRCMTCGGWWRVLKTSAEDLWSAHEATV